MAESTELLKSAGRGQSMALLGGAAVLTGLGAGVWRLFEMGRDGKEFFSDETILDQVAVFGLLGGFVVYIIGFMISESALRRINQLD